MMTALGLKLVDLGVKFLTLVAKNSQINITSNQINDFAFRVDATYLQSLYLRN